MAGPTSCSDGAGAREWCSVGPEGKSGPCCAWAAALRGDREMVARRGDRNRRDAPGARFAPLHPGRADARDEPSARLSARLAMRQEAHLREDERFEGGWTDTVVYAVLRRERDARAVRR